MSKKLFVALPLLLLAVQAWCQTALVVRQVTVSGNANISSDAILQAAKITVGRPASTADLLNAEDAVRNLGYFKDAKVLSRAVSDTETDVTIEVVEYPVVREFQFLGNSVVTTEELTKLVSETVQPGLVWSNRNARPIRDAIVKLYEDRGYFVQLDRIEPSEESPGTLTIGVIEPTVNEIRLVGLDKTRESTVRRVMKTRPGRPLSARLWRRDMEELYYTYWFETITPANPEPTEVPGQYNLTVEFKEARTGQLNVGVALDPQSRLVGTASYSDSNFRGMGQSVGLQLSQATVGGGPSVELAYGNRFFDSRDTSMNVQVFSKVVYNFTGSGFDPIGGGGDTSQFDERRTGFSVSFSRPINQYRATLGLRGQNIRTLDIAPDIKEEFIQQDGDLLTLQIGAAYDVATPSVEPHSGDRATVLIEPGYSNITRIGGVVSGNKDVLGQNFFVRTTFEYRRYWSNPVPDDTPLDKARPVVAFRARYGVVSGTVPFFEQLFLGGSDSLRGYENQRFWGKQSFLSSVEYRYPIQRSFGLIGFVDYGGAWGGYGQLKDLPQDRRAAFHLGYGLGISFRTPIAPIRIDFAFNDKGQTRTHFSFATSF